MENELPLEFYNLIKINPSPEIWLKSRRVKIRMLKTLMNNIKFTLTRFEIPFHKFQLTKDSARILFFFNNKEIPNAIKALKKVFGIYSFNPALRTSNKIKNITEKLVLVGQKILQKGDTFALRVKRSGKHEYTSHDIAVKGGQAIIDNFRKLNLKVNLSNPMKKFYIEVRGDFSYIYTKIIKTEWGGLPIERNKKILVPDIGRLSDLLAGFLLMRRGCEIYPILFQLIKDNNYFKSRLSNWEEIAKYCVNYNFIVRKVNLIKIIERVEKILKEKKYICAICRLVRLESLSIMLKELNIENFDRIRGISDGVSLNNISFCPDEVDLESIALNYLFSTYPIFTPIIGLESNKVEKMSSKISKNLVNTDYCQFKPKNQEINVEKLKILYKSLNLNEHILENLKNTEEIKIF
ncbi:MAG: THUMP domain-containing protein [Candidatus Thorarchaeota archaeon]